ncbi:MAG TPA: prenyltransferase/squalene oxidase repeat-containing protein [Gemmataceae bacterium]|nr:prenyltransferase/squalene oxidase repeat-containing protein [Gemmataceae bacterium]
MRSQSPHSNLVLSALALAALSMPAARADEMSAEQRKAVQKGLEWLAKTQQRDGHWEAFAGQFPMAMTGISGMALLMEGSTIREGKYKDNIRRATDWLMARSMPNGMLGNPNMPGESGRYMYGHGFATLFLSCVVGEEEEGDRRRRLVDILERACKFSAAAQTDRGGWGYVSAREGNNFDEGSVTITQVQALRAARNAGIAVPQQAIKMAQKYLADSTNAQGGVVYSLGAGHAGGAGRPALTAAAISCGFGFGDYNSPLVKKWFKFCQQNLQGLGGGTRQGFEEYSNYYYAQAVYVLGDDGYARLFPDSKPSERLTWSGYKKENFESMIRSQAADGSWSGSGGIMVDAHFTTPAYLTILLLDNAALPIYQR